MNDTSIAFIIVTYNEYTSVIKLVDSILKWKSINNDLIHIVIVDNCSIDNTYDLLRDTYESFDSIVHVIKSGKNGGYGYGNNFGVKYITSLYNIDYLVICNPDIYISEDDFNMLLDGFQENNISSVSCVMRNIDGSSKNGIQKIPSYYDDLRMCYFMNAKCAYDDIEYIDKDKKYAVSQMLPGSFFIIKSSIFHDIGGYDENLFLFCEERTLGKKILDKGYRQLIRIDKCFLHEHHVTIKKNLSILYTQKLILRSRLYYNIVYNNISFLKKSIFMMSSCIHLMLLYGINTVHPLYVKYIKR